MKTESSIASKKNEAITAIQWSAEDLPISGNGVCVRTIGTKLILGTTFYTPALEAPLVAALARLSWPCPVVCVPYNQLTAFLLDPRSVISEDSDFYAVLLLRVEDLIHFELVELSESQECRQELYLHLLRQRANELVDVLSRISQLRLTVLICPSTSGTNGKIGFLDGAINILNHKVGAALRSRQQHLLLDWWQFEAASGPGNWFNPAGDRLGHVPFSPEGLHALAEFVAGRIPQMPENRLENNANGAAMLDLQQFLASLELRITVSQLAQDDARPVADLLRHATDFVNLHRQDWRQDDSRLLAIAPGEEGFVVRVQDRFGDYGISGVVIISLLSDVMRIRLMFLSCPVLGKQVEYVLFGWLARLAQIWKANCIEIDTLEGKQNRPFFRFLDSLGAKDKGVVSNVTLPENILRFRISAGELLQRTIRQAPNPQVVSDLLSKMQIPEPTLRAEQTTDTPYRSSNGNGQGPAVALDIGVKQSLSALEAAILKYLCNSYPAVRAQGLGYQDSLLGVLDSLAVLGIIGFIESEFSIELNPSDVTDENFATVSAISQLVERLAKY